MLCPLVNFDWCGMLQIFPRCICPASAKICHAQKIGAYLFCALVGNGSHWHLQEWNGITVPSISLNDKNIAFLGGLAEYKVIKFGIAVAFLSKLVYFGSGKGLFAGCIVSCHISGGTSLWLWVQAVFLNYHVGIGNKVKWKECGAGIGLPAMEPRQPEHWLTQQVHVYRQ